ncbi:MAG: hypothetical protein LBQ54_10645 [Planctomycetaceae bacterium]|nr:hypothetical protein [Planctomycetaceae bacterium]
MGSSELAELEQRLPPELTDRVEIVGSACLEACHHKHYGAAPFVRINRSDSDRDASPQLSGGPMLHL